MYKKRTSIFIVTLLLLSMVLTGCGADTVGFLSHLDEMQKKATVHSTQTVSTLSLSDIDFPAELVPADVSGFAKLMDRYYISTTQKVNPTKDIVSISVDAIKKDTHEKEHLLTLKYKDQAFAMSAGPKLNELLKLAPPEVQATFAAFDNKLIPISALDDALRLQQVLVSSLSNRKDLLKVNQKSMTYLKELISIYTTADLPIIRKENNSYVFQMDTPEFIKVIDSLVTRTLENPEAIFNATLKFYESLTEEEFNMLYGEVLPGDKAEIIALFNEAISEPIPEGTLEKWNALYNSKITPVLLSTIDGSSLRMRTWKENNTYYTNTYGILKVAVPDMPSMKFGGTLLTEEEMQIISDDFDITMPTEVISDSVLKSILPAPVNIEELTKDVEVKEEIKVTEDIKADSL